MLNSSHIQTWINRYLSYQQELISIQMFSYLLTLVERGLPRIYISRCQPLPLSHQEEYKISLMQIHPELNWRERIIWMIRRNDGLSYLYLYLSIYNIFDLPWLIPFDSLSLHSQTSLWFPSQILVLLLFPLVSIPSPIAMYEDSRLRYFPPVQDIEDENDTRMVITRLMDNR